jgi:hypothetical protein
MQQQPECIEPFVNLLFWRKAGEKQAEWTASELYEALLLDEANTAQR